MRAPVVVTCTTDSCHAEAIVTDPRHLPNLERWRCPACRRKP